MAIIQATEESKTWNAKGLREMVDKVKGSVAPEETAGDGTPLYGYWHPMLPDNVDLWVSPAMCCAALLEALRDKLNDEFPVERKAA